MNSSAISLNIIISARNSRSVSTVHLWQGSSVLGLSTVLGSTLCEPKIIRLPLYLVGGYVDTASSLSCTLLNLNKRVFPQCLSMELLVGLQCLQGDKYVTYSRNVKCHYLWSMAVGYSGMEAAWKYKTVQSGREQQFSPECSSLLQGRQSFIKIVQDNFLWSRQNFESGRG